MTVKQADKWLAMALALALWSGRAAGQQPPATEKKPAEKPAEKSLDAKTPSGDERPMPDSPAGRRGRPYFFGPEDGPPGGGPPGGGPPGGGPPGALPGIGPARRPGSNPDGRYEGQRDGRPPRDGGPMRDGPMGGHLVPPFGPGGMMAPFDPQRLEEMRKYDPEMYELESKDQELDRQTLELSQQLRRAPRDQRDAIKKQLQELVQKHFDARQARRDLQLKRLETELERMRAGMQKRVEMRDQIVGRRVAELSGEQNDFDF